MAVSNAILLRLYDITNCHSARHRQHPACLVFQGSERSQRVGHIKVSVNFDLYVDGWDVSQL